MTRNGAINIIVAKLLGWVRFISFTGVQGLSRFRCFDWVCFLFLLTDNFKIYNSLIHIGTFKPQNIFLLTTGICIRVLAIFILCYSLVDMHYWQNRWLFQLGGTLQINSCLSWKYFGQCFLERFLCIFLLILTQGSIAHLIFYLKLVEKGNWWHIILVYLIYFCKHTHSEKINFCCWSLSNNFCGIIYLQT